LGVAGPGETAPHGPVAHEDLPVWEAVAGVVVVGVAAVECEAAAGEVAADGDNERSLEEGNEN
jgi:hypothetical protein